VDAVLEHGPSDARPSSVVSRSLVAVTGARSTSLLVLVEHRRLDRAELRSKTALGPRLLGLALRVEPNWSISSRVCAPLGDPLAAVNWSGRSMSHDAPQDAAIRTGVGAETDAAHRLDAARDPDVDGARAVSPAIKPLACWPLPR
jgi:hypothetical protein